MPTATETTTFRSKDQTLRLVKERTQIGLNSDGTQNVKPDVTIEFSNVGGRGEYVPANDPQFRDDTSAQSDVVDWLRNHRLYNVDFFDDDPVRAGKGGRQSE